MATAPGPMLTSPGRVTRDAVLALAAFYSAGGLLSLVSLAVPAWSGRHEAVLLVVGLLATAVGAALPTARRRLTGRHCFVLVLLGSLLIAALVYAGAGGGASATYAGFYVWVAVYSFLFFSPRGAAVQVLVAVLSQVAVLVQLGELAVVPAQVALSAGTMVATGAVVGVLAARLRALTLTDELTGLPNRRSLNATLSDRLSQDRSRPAIAVLGIDLDGSKALNDSLGHAAGDSLLQRVAALWSAELRNGDVLARIGGDEFIVVLTDCDADRAVAVARRIVAVVPAPASACVGVVALPAAEESGDLDTSRILTVVDGALNEGKSRGPGSVVVGQPYALDIPASRTPPE